MRTGWLQTNQIYPNGPESKSTSNIRSLKDLYSSYFVTVYFTKNLSLVSIKWYYLIMLRCHVKLELSNS